MRTPERLIKMVVRWYKSEGLVVMVVIVVEVKGMVVEAC